MCDKSLNRNDRLQLMLLSRCFLFLLQASQVKRQRDMFESDIGQLHASTMALVQDVS